MNSIRKLFCKLGYHRWYCIQYFVPKYMLSFLFENGNICIKCKEELDDKSEFGSLSFKCRECDVSMEEKTQSTPILLCRHIGKEK